MPAKGALPPPVVAHSPPPAPAQVGGGDLFDRLSAGLDTLLPLLPTRGDDLVAPRAPPRHAVRAVLATVPGVGVPADGAVAVDWLLNGAAAEAPDLGADAAGDLPRSAVRAAALAAVRPADGGSGGGRRGARGLLRSLLRRKQADADAARVPSAAAAGAELEAALAAAAAAAVAEAAERNAARVRLRRRYGRVMAQMDLGDGDGQGAQDKGGKDKPGKGRKGGSAAAGEDGDGDAVAFDDALDDDAAAAAFDDDNDAFDDEDDDDDYNGDPVYAAESRAAQQAEDEIDALLERGADAADAAAAAAAAAAERAAAVATRERDLRTKSYTQRAREAARAAAETDMFGPDVPGPPTAADVLTPAEEAAREPTVTTDVRLPAAALLPTADVDEMRRGLAKRVPRPGSPEDAAARAAASLTVAARGVWSRRAPWPGAGLVAALFPAATAMPDVTFAVYAHTRETATALARWAGRDGAATAADPDFRAAVVAAAAACQLTVMAHVPRDLPAAALASGLGAAAADAAARGAAAAFRADVAKRKVALSVGALPPLPTAADVASMDWPCLSQAVDVAASGRALAVGLASAARAAADAGGEGWVTAAGVIPAGTKFIASALPGDEVIIEALPPPPPTPGLPPTNGVAGLLAAWGPPTPTPPTPTQPPPVVVARGAAGSASALFGALVGSGAVDPVAAHTAGHWFAFCVNAALPGARMWLPSLDLEAAGLVDRVDLAAARFRLALPGGRGQAPPMLLGGGRSKR